MSTNPQHSDVYVSEPLTNISIAYLQNADNFVADRVFPMVPVKIQGGKFWTYNRGDFNRDEMQKRAPGTESAGSGYSVTTDTYYCEKWAIHKDIDDETRANESSVLDSDQDATEFLSQKALIRKERIWATNFFASSKWATDYTPSNLWSTDDGTPIEDMSTAHRTILEATGLNGNTLVLGKLVKDKLVNHPDIVDRIKYGQTPGAPAIAQLQALAALFEVDRILVMKGVYNSAKEGQTESSSFIGGAHALLCHVASRPGLRTPSAGYTYGWTGLLGGQAMGTAVSKFRMKHLKSDRIELEMAFDMKLVASDLGYFFDTVAS